MSSIKIAELRPAGSELFQDSESFLNELSDGQEMDMVLGGGGVFSINTASLVTVSNVNVISFLSNVNFNKGKGKGKGRRRRRRRGKH
ncbi:MULTISPECIES: hypothetical protein [unclassified Moorena]|uniref:hypothetical protein n=1 Tax=unclassified Moorena TaxID=2683338 RepID=UPI0013BD02EA|nr:MULTISPECIES: hypothetical protein [unclassified Moorena]NEQ12304.1 hypothetical protein [Moorena sp. SIO4E2]NER86444.1 hypothetical protein [Moorena sp. SIO3A2]NET66115.1 hypothetical protein [Moorena sp. SIO1G6]